MKAAELLKSKNNKEAYKLLCELETLSETSDELYADFDSFVSLLSEKSSFVRVRGFRICCAQAKWDRENKLDEKLDELLAMLDDEKPAAVRQCLMALGKAVREKPELRGRIEEKLNSMDASKYKDSMRPLIEKDIRELRELIKNS